MKFSFWDLLKLVKDSKIIFAIVAILSFVLFSLKLSPIESLIQESKQHVLIRDLKYVNIKNEVVEYVQGRINAINYNYSRPDEKLEINNYPNFIEIIGNDEVLFNTLIQLPVVREFPEDSGFSFSFYKVRHSVCKDDLLLDQILRVSFAAPFTLPQEKLNEEFIEVNREIASKYLTNHIDALISLVNLESGEFFVPPSDFSLVVSEEDESLKKINNPYKSTVKVELDNFVLTDIEFQILYDIIEKVKVLVLENKAIGVMETFKFLLSNSNLSTNIQDRILEKLNDQIFNYQTYRDNNLADDIYSVSTSKHPWKALFFCLIFSLVFSFGITALWEIVKLYRKNKTR